MSCSCLKRRWDVDLVELARRSIVNGQGLPALAGLAFGGLHALGGGLHACLIPALLDGDLLSGGRSRRSSHN